MGGLPNFLIVGAAKAGTTSLAHYLDSHRQVLFSSPKEPKFFSWKYANYKGPGDVVFTKKKVIKTLEEYQNLFAASNRYSCIGEGSVDNLFYHHQVIPDIKQILGEPKIIILLRHPVDRAVSAYSHLVRDGREKMSFDLALKLEEERLEKGFEFIWGYKKGGLYFDPVQNYSCQFPQVHCILFDNLIAKTQETINNLCDFLEIPSLEIQKHPPLNISGESKNQALNQLISRDTAARRFFTNLVGRNKALRIKNAIQRRNIDKIVIPNELKHDLAPYFKEDLLKLQEFLQMDLSSWIKKYDPS